MTRASFCEESCKLEMLFGHKKKVLKDACYALGETSGG